MMTSVATNEVARTEAIDFARRLIQRWQETLGADLLGAYLIGSLAHAGFNRRYSDIDLAIVTEAGLSQEALDGLKSEAMALSGIGARKSRFSGRTGTFLSADFRHSIASIFLIMQSR